MNKVTTVLFGIISLQLLFDNLIVIVKSFDIYNCDMALGMTSGAIPDSAITASSAYVPNVGPKNARLNVEKAGGAWCPKSQIERNVREYLQVDFNRTTIVTAIETQGRYGYGRGQEYMEEYTIEYWRPSFGNRWQNYTYFNGKQILNGNSDTSTVVRNRLKPVIYANSIRILPYSVHKRTVCLRAEFSGCSDSSSIVSYSLPNKFEFSPDLSDSIYDGKEKDGFLVDGLGKLIDGHFGSHIFHFNKESAWVAWKRDSFPESVKPYVDLRFKFDETRRFDHVNIHANSFHSRGIRFFSRAKIQFSTESDRFSDSENAGDDDSGDEEKLHEITFNQHLNDPIAEQSKNITINLFKQLAKFIRIQLYFESHWILISEVIFDSELIHDEKNKNAESPIAIGTRQLPSVTSSILTMTTNHQAINDQNNSHNSDIEIIIGILMAVLFLIVIISVIILLMNRKQSLNIFYHHHHNQNTSSSNNINKKDATANHHNNLLLFENQNFQFQFKNMKNILMNLHKKNHAENCCASDSIVNINHQVLDKLPTSFSLSLENIHENDQIIANKLNNYHTVNNSKIIKTNKFVTFCGNIVPLEPISINDYRDIELVPIPRYCLKYISDIGSCYYSGTIRMFETVNLSDIIKNVAKTVLLKNVCNSQLVESLCEFRFLASLQHPNVVKVVGVCTAEHPPSILIEYSENGDLVEYLQYELQQHRQQQQHNLLDFSALNRFAVDIAAAMLYLETKKVIHKDLAARNCLMSVDNRSIKIADIAVTKPQYRQDYIEVDDNNNTLVPIRWLPWESVLLEKYSSSSVVWSFGIFMWELTSFAAERPYCYLNDSQVLQNLECMFYGDQLQMQLKKPEFCPVQIYELMCECWRRDDNNRPTFFEIYHFLNKFEA